MLRNQTFISIIWWQILFIYSTEKKWIWNVRIVLISLRTKWCVGPLTIFNHLKQYMKLFSLSLKGTRVSFTISWFCITDWLWLHFQVKSQNKLKLQVFPIQQKCWRTAKGVMVDFHRDWSVLLYQNHSN